MNENELAVVIVDAAFVVHRTLGPGLLESIYAAALSIELAERGLGHEREVGIHATFATGHWASPTAPIRSSSPEC